MKYKINYNEVAHGAISWSHEGNDSQYCEAGEPVVLSWQPTTGWGLAEAHYTDGDGNVTSIDLETRTFTMPAKDITISGTFKRFVLEDWKSDQPAPMQQVYALIDFDSAGIDPEDLPGELTLDDIPLFSGFSSISELDEKMHGFNFVTIDVKYADYIMRVVNRNCNAVPGSHDYGLIAGGYNAVDGIAVSMYAQIQFDGEIIKVTNFSYSET